MCHDEVVVECDAEQAEDVKAWLAKTMIEGMNTILKRHGRGTRVGRGRNSVSQKLGRRRLAPC
jgi:hypothetical protein